jgi:hypothetical protein
MILLLLVLIPWIRIASESNAVLHSYAIQVKKPIPVDYRVIFRAPEDCPGPGIEGPENRRGPFSCFNSGEGEARPPIAHVETFLAGKSSQTSKGTSFRRLKQAVAVEFVHFRDLLMLV